MFISCDLSMFLQSLPLLMYANDLVWRGLIVNSGVWTISGKYQHFFPKHTNLRVSFNGKNISADKTAIFYVLFRIYVKWDFGFSYVITLTNPDYRISTLIPTRMPTIQINNLTMNMTSVTGTWAPSGTLRGGKVLISWVHFRRKVSFFLLFCNLTTFCRDAPETVFINKAIVPALWFLNLCEICALESWLYRKRSCVVAKQKLCSEYEKKRFYIWVEKHIYKT